MIHIVNFFIWLIDSLKQKRTQPKLRPNLRYCHTRVQRLKVATSIAGRNHHLF